MSILHAPESTLRFRVIDGAESLQHFCQLARSAGWFAIDSEFVRQRTYYAKLGLLQAHAQGETVIIDPISGIDLAPVWSLITDPAVTTVLHSGGEDIEIFYNEAGQRAPTAIFDTQIAAGFCGMGSSMGYAKLVEALFGGVELDKSLSRTDWLKRPLTPEQLDYAAADASYLSVMYPYLLEQCQQHKVLDIVEEESALQVSKRTQSIDDDLLYLFVGNAWQLNAQQLAVLQALTAWRLNKAKRRDMPIGFLFKDGTLLELARRQPRSEKQLQGINDLPPLTRKYSGKEIIDCIERANQLSASDYPKPLQRLDDMPAYKGAVKTMKAAVGRLAETLGVDSTLVASRKQMNDFLNFNWQFSAAQRERLPLPDLQQGWRWRHLEAELSRII